MLYDYNSAVSLIHSVTEADLIKKEFYEDYVIYSIKWKNNIIPDVILNIINRNNAHFDDYENQGIIAQLRLSISKAEIIIHYKEFKPIFIEFDDNIRVLLYDIVEDKNICKKLKNKNLPIIAFEDIQDYVKKHHITTINNPYKYLSMTHYLNSGTYVRINSYEQGLPILSKEEIIKKGFDLDMQITELIKNVRCIKELNNLNE